MVISVLSSIIVLGCTAIILLRTASNSGFKFPDSKLTSFIFADKRIGSSYETTAKEFMYVFSLALLFRLIVFGLSAITVALWNDSDFTLNSFFSHYVQWDANNYQRIADLGYAGYNENGDFTTLAFFPLYSWTARMLSILLRNTYASLLTTSFICYAAGCGFLYKLCALDYGRNTAKNAVIFISVFPHGLFFGTMMNESIFFMFTVITLYFIRQHKWWLVGIFGALASLTRLAGIVLAFPALIEFIEYYNLFGKIKEKKFGEVCIILFKIGSPVFIMLLGTFIYLYCNYRTTGEWFKFLDYQQKYWNHHSTYFGTGVKNVFNNAFNADKPMILAAIHIPSVISIIFVLAAMVYGLRRSRSMYSIYLIIYFIVNMSVDWIISTPRYMSCALPAFIFLADFADRHKWSEPLITASMAVGFGIYLTAYLFGKQIL